MNISTLTNRFTKIILNPALGWKDCCFDELNLRRVFFPFFFGIITVTFLARLTGKTLNYLSVYSIVDIILYSVLSLAVDVIYFFIIVVSVNALLPFYKKEKDTTKVSVLLMLSLIPFYSSIVIYNLFPSLFFLNIVSIYSLFLLYWGLARYIKIDKKDLNVSFIIITIILLGIYFILHFLLIYPFFEFIF